MPSWRTATRRCRRGRRRSGSCRTARRARARRSPRCKTSDCTVRRNAARHSSYQKIPNSTTQDFFMDFRPGSNEPHSARHDWRMDLEQQNRSSRTRLSLCADSAWKLGLSVRSQLYAWAASKKLYPELSINIRLTNGARVHRHQLRCRILRLARPQPARRLARTSSHGSLESMNSGQKGRACIGRSSPRCGVDRHLISTFAEPLRMCRAPP